MAIFWTINDPPDLHELKWPLRFVFLIFLSHYQIMMVGSTQFYTYECKAFLATFTHAYMHRLHTDIHKYIHTYTHIIYMYTNTYYLFNGIVLKTLLLLLILTRRITKKLIFILNFCQLQPIINRETF